MEDIIRLLPDSIANQIAAGEVVQRPASAVKELLENSIDAKATYIKLIVKEAGKSHIQVVDNGIGMSHTDARMCFERHATSKIKKAEELFQIRSMGFRGEALASIAAVAQVEMKTRRSGDELGCKLVIEGSEVKTQEPMACATGTSIEVKNLFYNIPARRNFLKSNPVELRHINDEFQRVALSHPEVGFGFFQHDVEQYRLEPGKLSQRIVQLFGKSYQQQLIPCHEETPDIQIIGYVGKPEFSRKTRGDQFFYVNNRFIKNAYLNHAVANAYQGLLQDDHHPFYVLFIEMDPSRVDVNVHPTKTEVKFDDDRLLYGVIAAAVRQSLASFNVAPSLDFDTDVNFDQYLPAGDRGQVPTQSERAYSSFKTLEGTDRHERNLRNWESIFNNAESEEEKVRKVAIEELDRDKQVITIPSKQPIENLDFNDRTQTLTIHGKYLVRQVKSGMVVVDQRAAHERILFERYLSRLKSQRVSQTCLFPAQVELSASDLMLVEEIKSEIHQIGFDFDGFGGNTIVLSGVPPELSGTSEKDAFEELIEQYKWNQANLKLGNAESLARALAKRTALKNGQFLRDEEVSHLFDQLFACAQPNFTPDGQATFVVLGLEKLDNLFK